MRGAFTSFVLNALSQPEYQDLDLFERNVVAAMVISASILVDSARCADGSASDSAGWSAVLTVNMLNRTAGGALTKMPAARKAQLIDKAMEIEAHRQAEQDLVPVLCNGDLLPDEKSKPLTERRSIAKQVLEVVFSSSGTTGPANP
jgi:hypothetical protein